MVDILTRRVAFAHYLEPGKCRTETWRKHRGCGHSVTLSHHNDDNGHVRSSPDGLPVLRIDAPGPVHSLASYTSQNGEIAIAGASDSALLEHCDARAVAALAERLL
jgi:hypothetical protein